MMNSLCARRGRQWHITLPNATKALCNNAKRIALLRQCNTHFRHFSIAEARHEESVRVQTA
jgi:hypothetical protein